jgi:hypothetical protein
LAWAILRLGAAGGKPHRFNAPAESGVPATEHQAIEALMARYANLYADLGAMMYTGGEGYGSYWPRRTQWIHLIADANGTLLPDMKALFERHADRFLVGTDSAHARVYQFYGQRAALWRLFLGQLSPAAQIAIAHGNAERLFAA